MICMVPVICICCGPAGLPQSVQAQLVPDVQRALACLLGGRLAAAEKLLPPLLHSAPACLQRTADLRDLFAALAQSSGGVF